MILPRIVSDARSIRTPPPWARLEHRGSVANRESSKYRAGTFTRGECDNRRNDATIDRCARRTFSRLKLYGFPRGSRCAHDGYQVQRRWCRRSSPSRSRLGSSAGCRGTLMVDTAVAWWEPASVSKTVRGSAANRTPHENPSVDDARVVRLMAHTTP